MWSLHAKPSGEKITAGGCESGSPPLKIGFYNDLIVRAEGSA
jgi:hypothetical protein